MNTNRQGYIAVVTAIITTALMLAVVAVLSVSFFSSRFNNVNFYNKKTSYYAARSCLDKGLLELSQNSDYGGDVSLPVGNFQCQLLPIEESGNTKIIKARSEVVGAVTNLYLVVDAATLSTISLTEPISF